MSNQAKVFIGIDGGKQTGFALWIPATHSHGYFKEIITIDFWTAFFKVVNLTCQYNARGTKVIVVVEDPNENAPVFKIDYLYRSTKATHIGKLNAVAKKGQNVGSVKRESALMIQGIKRLTHFDMEVLTVRPTGGTMTKLKAGPFKAMTKWEGRTNEHSRDAAMIVFGR